MYESDNARVNRADKKCKFGENRVGYNGRSRPSDDKPTLTLDYASAQRFVIPAADVSRASILAIQPNEVEHVVAWIEHVDSMSERICLTNSLFS